MQASTCSINILSSSCLEEGPSHSSSNLICFTAIGVGNYGYLILLSDDEFDGEDEGLPHPISLLNISRRCSLRFRSQPEASSIEELNPPPKLYIIALISYVTSHLVSSSTSSSFFSNETREPLVYHRRLPSDSFE